MSQASTAMTDTVRTLRRAYGDIHILQIQYMTITVRTLRRTHGTILHPLTASLTIL